MDAIQLDTRSHDTRQRSTLENRPDIRYNIRFPLDLIPFSYGKRF